MKYLYHIEVAPGLEYDCVAEADVEIHCGDVVVVKCERYQDSGVVSSCSRGEAVDLGELEKRHSQRSRGRQVEGHHVPDVLRLADERDVERREQNAQQAESMQVKARERIAAHGLDMKLIHTHCSLDRRLAVFQFSAEGRVDFRELLRDLSHQFRTRVELRQIGVRDEAAIQGGIGACGRAFCCATFLRKFNSINVKMAKAQGLSLNPANISGACGRLKCCLEYEVDRYREESRQARSRDRDSQQQESGGDDQGRSASGRGSDNRDRRSSSSESREGKEKGEDGASSAGSNSSSRGDGPSQSAAPVRGRKRGKRQGRGRRSGQNKRTQPGD